MSITPKFVFNPFSGNFDSTLDVNLSYAQVKYVDKTNTFTYTADGSLDKPYKSIEDMYNAITDASGSKKYAVLIAPGTYTEADTIRIKGWIDLTSFATDTVSIAVAGGGTLKWSNNNPGRVFIKDIGFTSGFEILNDNPTGTSGLVFDLDNVDAPSVIFNGRGGGIDFIQLRNDTRISGSCTIRSAATTIFDSTNISNLIMSDVGCVVPDAFGSAITASLRANYIGAIQITATTYDVYTDAWGTIVAGNLNITSNSPSSPCYFNHDATSYPLGTITLTGSNPAQVVATSVAQAIRYTPATPANWFTVPNNVKEGLDTLKADIDANNLLYVLKTGDTMSGTLSVSVPASGTSNLGWQGVSAQSADSTQSVNCKLDYMSIYYNDPGLFNLSTEIYPNHISLAGTDIGTGTTYNTEIQDARITLSFSDGVTTYPIIPLLPEEVTTKEYVDKLVVLSVISPSINTTMTVNNKVALCSNTITITLPLASAVVTAIYVKNIGTGVITVDGNGSQTIDGALTYALTNQWDSITLVSNGTGWFIL